MNAQTFAPNAKNILVIDDDKDEQEFLVTAFEEEAPNCHIVCLDNGKNSFSYLLQLPEEELPFLIVLDYNMPGWNGGDVLRHLQEVPRLKRIPVILYSTAGNFHNDTTGATAIVEKAGTWTGIKKNVQSFLFYGRPTQS